MTGRRPQHATPSSGDSFTPTDVLALSRAFCFFLAPRPRRHATDRASPAPTHAMDPARAPPQGLPRSTAPSASARPWMDLPLLPRSSKERWPPLYIAGGAHSCRAHGTHPFKGLAADHEGQLGAPLCPCRRLTIFPWQSPPLQQGLADHKDQLGACFGISHEREAILTMHLQQRLPCHTQTQPAEQPCQLGGQVAGQAEGGEEGQREAGGAFCDEQTKTLWFFKRIGRREGAGFICRVEMMLPVLPCYLCWFYVSSRDGVRQ